MHIEIINERMYIFKVFLSSHTVFCSYMYNFFESGGRLNKKDRLTGYGDPHVKDKTSYRPSYL